MKKIFIVLFILVSSSVTHATTLMVGPLKDDSIIDVGCTFQHPTQKNKVMAFTDWEYKNLWINLNGKDHQFQKAQTKPDMTSAGLEKYTKKYKNGSQTIEITNIVTGECNTENCESVSISATIKISDGKETKVVQTQGSCGA